MKTIVAGSRTVQDVRVVFDAIDRSGFTITEIVSGGCHGPDTFGERWALARHVPIKRFVAEWDRYGLKAGPIRNCDMAAYAEALIAVWDRKSRGTAHMIAEAIKRGLKVYVHEVKS